MKTATKKLSPHEVLLIRDTVPRFSSHRLSGGTGQKQPLIVRYGATPKHCPITGGLRTSLLADQYIPPISGAWISGLAQTLIYADFFYYYFNR
ncbi:hypothetical protein BHM03_00029222 [Ensete ventricosum]|nr:hypothetical protein BHM03_00029222 [Ensete ventricosum]